MKRFPLLIMFFCLGITLSTAQERGIVQGYCKDENGKPIENVSVYVSDSLLVSVTDEQGRFTYGYAQAGMKLRFAHMVFEPTYYTIKEKDIGGKSLTISMKTKSHELLEVEVTANAPHIAFDNPVMSILDYVICDDGIYMIAYRRRNSALLHLSFEMDTLHELRISSEYKYIIRIFMVLCMSSATTRSAKWASAAGAKGKRRRCSYIPPWPSPSFTSCLVPSSLPPTV